MLLESPRIARLYLRDGTRGGVATIFTLVGDSPPLVLFQRVLRYPIACVIWNSFLRIAFQPLIVSPECIESAAAVVFVPTIASTPTHHTGYEVGMVLTHSRDTEVLITVGTINAITLYRQQTAIVVRLPRYRCLCNLQ